MVFGLGSPVVSGRFLVVFEGPKSFEQPRFAKFW